MAIIQKCTFSSEVEKTTEDLTEHLKSLQTEQASLQSENAQLQSENETLQKNFKVMMERYQENMMKLHRKLRVEENYRVEQEEKLSKVEEKMSHTIKVLETYRKRAQYLEEQLQRTIHSCLGKIISSEKEAHASELAARIAERNLSYFRKQNARNRQKLTEKELRFELVEKDPYDALDVSNSAMGRKPSPNGPSPIGHPSSERRPPHLEKSGPLTLSPFTPVGGGGGSRGPENPLHHATSSKGRESSCHKFTDFQRAPSDWAPLSPPGEQASRLMIPPPGQPYSSDARLPLQRQDRFYSNCGRASGPAEHRIPNMPPLDSDVPDSPLHAENQATGSGSVLAPFPPVRGALLPVDPRSQFMRRGPFFSSTSPRKLVWEPGDYVPPDPPPTPFPMRSVYAGRGFPHNLPPRAGFSPLHPHSESTKILEGGRIQKCTFSSEVEKTTEDLTEHLKSLQTEQASLQSENAQLQSENETLQKNFKVMMERYQENMMKLHRKLRVEENYRVEQEEKLSKVEEKMSHTIKELETYRKRAQYLEEQLQRTIHSCLGKIISSEKEAHASELAARIAERNLSYFRKQNARNRQKLTEKELRFELVEKDPYDALDVSNSAMGRKPSPNGPSPIGHPSSERRPPHLEKSGPLTLSPFTPVGGGGGSRGPGNPLHHATSSKGRESSCHKFTDFQRAPSQTGPLSPPGEQASRLMIPPPGQPYSSDARLPLQRQDRFYSNCAPRVVAALSEDMKPGHLPYGFPWELVMCTALGFSAVLSLFWRGFQSVRSRLYVGREKRLALNLAGLIEAKCGLLEKVSLVEKEHEGLESPLKDCRFEKGSREARQLEATDEKLHRSESSHGVEVLFLEEELKAQKAQHGQEDETMAHLSRRIQSLQGESESLRSQIAEAKTNWRLFQVNEEELKLAIKELKASLEILEGGRIQKCTFSSEVEKTTEDLTEHLKSLQTEQASLQSENAQLQSENETLQKNFKVMMERYQENMMKLHRKLRVEENYRVEQEEKLSKVEEKMSHTIKVLETYRKRAQYLEEQLQRTIHSCLGKIISSEKEAHASELAARIAERNLSYFRKQNARNRQKLTEKELRFELVEKDPYDALDVSNSAMGRKPSPNGPSPIGHPSSERRPPHLEKSGPLTLSPFTPVGGGGGSRGPGNPLHHATSSKGRESSCHKFTDFQRAPSQTGPLSPPGEQASRLMIPPPGQPYSSDARLPLQRQDRFYSNCGRASGPAEHRIPNMPPLDSDTEQASLQSENAQLQSENETLQKNFKVMMERYQENMMKLHRKLRVEENYRVEQEEKLSKVEEKMSHTIKVLETYRKRAQYLEEQLQRTIHSCLGKIISSEKEAHASELAARIAERNLSYFRKQNARNRQKLTEKELRFELVEKDPYDALDVSNSAMGRKPSPNGPSPIGHPSSERRPPHLEKSGPLTLSPFTPVGGGGGSRGPGNPLHHATSSKGRESSCHKFTDFQRAPSQTGPLSPPGEQASRLMIPPPGQPYSSDARLPLQRQDRFYSNCGRASGPAEHRIPNMPPLDSDVPDSPLHAENQATGSGSVLAPFPPVRGALLPVDPRSPFMRRGPFFSSTSPRKLVWEPGDYVPPDPPPTPFPMRSVYAGRGFPHNLPPRAGIQPSTPPF
ncbi:LOW QUALITY PROTEIN: uncharacterized protein ACOB7L_006007 [Callospermophilus lateralis]